MWDSHSRYGFSSVCVILNNYVKFSCLWCKQRLFFGLPIGLGDLDTVSKRIKVISHIYKVHIHIQFVCLFNKKMLVFSILFPFSETFGLIY